MKKILFLLFLLFSSNHIYLFSQQYYYTFSELKGMEDSNNNTHLFYRLYTFQKGGSIIGDYYENSIYHLDFENEKDTLFLFDGGRLGDFTNSIVDLEFWDTDPSKFIYLGVGISVDPVAYIRRFDQPEHSYFELGEAFGLELGKQNDSLVIASAPALIKSTDGGFNWTTFTDSTYLFITSISPYSDDEMFFTSYGGSLYKTIDGGTTISLVDTAHFSTPQLFYDSDSIHIYNATNNSLRISNNSGNAFSWIERYSSSNPIYLSVDYSQSGSIYLADGRYIYHSTDYGVDFNEYKVLDRKIVGIYKKPNSDKLYAATKYDLYEITKDSIITIKHLSFNPDILSWYPLAIGNKWVYEHAVEMYTSKFAVEVVDDTLIAGKYFYKIKRYDLNDATYYYERIDSSNGKVYRYIAESENQIYDFTSTEFGDTVYFNEEDDYEIGWILEYEESFNSWGLTSTKRIFSGIIPTSGYRLYTFVKDIGLYRDEGGEVLYSAAMLKGFVKDGIVYGNLSLVGVDDDNEVPKEFSLSQNYPNPFNPTTNIGFRIAKFGFVSLKVFDVLGREVATLVNEEKQPGVYEVEFSAEGGSAYGGNASDLASGIYFYSIKAGDFSSTRKLILLK